MPSTKPLPPEVANKTGIREGQLARADGFPAIYEHIRSFLATRNLLVYHASFDVPRLQGNIRTYCGVEWKPVHAECLMLAYAAYRGERHGPKTKYAGEYVHWRLEQACAQMHVEETLAHRALADCRHSLALLRAMANP